MMTLDPDELAKQIAKLAEFTGIVCNGENKDLLHDICNGVIRDAMYCYRHVEHNITNQFKPSEES